MIKGEKKYLLVTMIYTILKRACSLCRKRAGHKVLQEESEKVHSSPGLSRI